MAELATFTAILTVELQPGARAPSASAQPLTRASAMEIAQAVGADLAAVAPDVSHCALVTVGALYDQTELLRPGFPVVGALESIHRAGLRETNGFSPGLIALGVDDPGQRFPIEVLNPGASPWRGPLLLSPALLVAPADTIAEIADTLESRLLHEAPAQSATWDALARHFGVTPEHVSYATIADLCALLNVQLENAGLSPLWELLEHAFLERRGNARVELTEGNQFVIEDNSVSSPFLSYACWSARHGAGDLGERVASYLRWTRSQRQYCGALEAYGLSVQLVVDGEHPPSEQGWLRETVHDRSDTHVRLEALVVTEHSHPDLGVVALSADLRGEDGVLLHRDHYYPLQPGALPRLVESLHSLAEAAQVELRTLRPGAICVAAGGADLTAADSPDAELTSGGEGP